MFHYAIRLRDDVRFLAHRTGDAATFAPRQSALLFDDRAAAERIASALPFACDVVVLST